MKKTILFLFANIFIFSFFSCAQKLPVQKLTVTTQKSGQICVLAEVAKTQAQRNRGFMERKNIPAGTGMKRYKNIKLDYGVNEDIMREYEESQMADDEEFADAEAFETEITEMEDDFEETVDNTDEETPEIVEID